jgi:hypothetical protein
MDIPRHYASGEEPGPLYDGVGEYLEEGGVGCWAKAVVPNRPVPEKEGREGAPDAFAGAGDVGQPLPLRDEAEHVHVDKRLTNAYQLQDLKSAPAQTYVP